MEFPEAQPIGRRERSIAERHRLAVHVWSVVSLVPAALVISLVDAAPLIQLLFTFLLAFATTWTLTRVLRGRFLALTANQELVLYSTLRAPGRRTSEAVQGLSTRGFAIVDTTVVATTSGVVLTRPIVVLRRPADGQVASASSFGSMLMTVLNDGTWLVTSTMASLAHPRLRIEQVAKRETEAMIESHHRRVDALAREGVLATDQPPAHDLVIGMEHMEQETVSMVRSSGLGAPSARALRRAAH